MGEEAINFESLKKEIENLKGLLDSERHRSSAFEEQCNDLEVKLNISQRNNKRITDELYHTRWLNIHYLKILMNKE